MKVALAGGGTGGHVFPAVAIAEELKRRDPHLQLVYIGKEKSIEERIASKRLIPFRPIIVEGMPGSNVFKKLRALVRAGVGLIQSVVVLLRFRPQAVIGTGGYASLPPVLAARILRIPTLIHEQNCIPGRANLLCSRYADVLTLNFEKSREYFSREAARVVGNPIRSDFLPEALENVDRAESRRELGLHPDKFTVFVLGGSRGAHSLNVAMLDALNYLDSRIFQLIWMTGKEDYRRVRDACEQSGVSGAVFQFVDNMVRAYMAADLAVSRAGASTLAELAAVGLPAILIPYPFATDRHQELNARALVEAGAADMILNGELDGKTLAAKIRTLSQDAASLERMRAAGKQFSRPDAAETIVNILFEIAFR